MPQALTRLTLDTHGQGFYEMTRPIADWVAQQHPRVALLTVFCRHTSASLLIQENADPTVREDLSRFLAALAPEDGRYEHSDEGPDDMPAHLRSMVTQTSLTIPVEHGRPLLGTWQGIYLAEHRRRPHRREVVLHLLAE
ncbi:secondary thiamine-phosphate synthase enzyme YjbQ [Lichenifustis flavocetrariae]|uniref:Secondary thiamine-phosphate synthase enzyme YjbQ n=1 Tax=Lichenifustis flavocetrariae TaxID=2949735 RepID=A0AA41Z1G3_9HYPH|nr:secondary thiamine-phosphate synthase enzyme YjbQ [Lichenifustis flavocetrariae]MCW6511964.1 secondary thiamine-phosphate synthase enzyme YjbQ [Lichenifustis flavocetrariae]